MAVVYADLRFTRGQVTGANPGRTNEDWNITYENVTIPKKREDPILTQRKCPRGLQAPRCFSITLILLSCTLMVVVIGLSVQLSQVSEHHLSTAAELQQLKGEHEDLGSRFTQNNERKDSMVQTLEENQRQTQQELGETKAALYQMQEKWKTTAQELQRAIRERDDKAATLTRLQGDLLSTETELQEKKDELLRCSSNFESVRTQKSQSDRTLTQTKSYLNNVQKKLTSVENRLSQKNTELSDVQKSVQNLQRNLSEKVRDSEKQEKKLTDLENRLSDAGTCLTSRDCSYFMDTDDAFAYCPAGWYQIGEMCYYFSSQEKARINAEDDCRARSALLAKVDDESSILMDKIGRTGKSFWIGLHKIDESWMWPDKTIKEDFQESSNQFCVKATPHLVNEPCRNKLPWICEMRIKTCGSKTETLRCLGEKIQMFGVKYPEQ